MSATRNTTDIRARITGKAIIDRLAETHKRAHGDIVEAMAQLAEAQPTIFAAYLEAVEPFRAAAGMGRPRGTGKRARYVAEAEAELAAQQSRKKNKVP